MGQSVAIRGLSKVKILRKFEKDFKELTELNIIYLDLKNNYILSPNQYCPLFKTLARTEKKDKFLKPIEEACKFVKENKKQKVFTCCSLLKVAVPIIANDEIVGIALTTPPVRDVVSSQMPADLTKNSGLTKIWQQLPAIKKEELEDWSQMLFDLLNYIFKNEYDFLIFSETQTQTTRAQETLHKALAYIKENYHHRDISLESVAKEVYLSHYYFSHLFKRELKMTFIKYLTKIRLEAAQKLLRNIKLNINQVAYAVGYQDPNYFSKVFKRNLKISPIDYRISILKELDSKKNNKI